MNMNLLAVLTPPSIYHFIIYKFWNNGFDIMLILGFYFTE